MQLCYLCYLGRCNPELEMHSFSCGSTIYIDQRHIIVVRSISPEWYSSA